MNVECKEAYRAAITRTTHRQAGRIVSSKRVEKGVVDILQFMQISKLM